MAFHQLYAAVWDKIVDYIGYIQVLLAIAFGYLIVSGIASFFYWSMRAKYEHATAAAVRNIVKIIGVGALVAAIAGGAAGVALGGFIGIVIGFCLSAGFRAGF